MFGTREMSEMRTCSEWADYRVPGSKRKGAAVQRASLNSPGGL